MIKLYSVLEEEDNVLDILGICQELTKEILPEQIYMNEPMGRHTTFKVGGNADVFVKVKSIKDLKYIIKIAKKYDIHITVIGNGSNLLVRDKGIRGIVAKIDIDTIKIEPLYSNDMQHNTIQNINLENQSKEYFERKKEINKQDNDTQSDVNKHSSSNLINNANSSETDKQVIVTVGAGVKLMSLAQELLKNNISGFEFASGIPGTIGGAVKMNAGAYGKEMKDIVVSTKCLDLKKYYALHEKSYVDDIEITEFINKTDEPEIIELTNEQQNFTYRDSVFSDKRYVILETKLALSYGNQEEIKEKMQEYSNKRKATQPNLPSAGSTFKRGEDYITAKLIDECGLKGYKIRGAQVSEKHAGFIVNTGDATAQDIIDLINYVKKVVYENTGKIIKLEVEIVGE